MILSIANVPSIPKAAIETPRPLSYEPTTFVNTFEKPDFRSSPHSV